MKKIIGILSHLLALAVIIMAIPVQAAGSATLSISPATSTIKVGDTTNLTVRLNTGGQTISAVGLSISVSTNLTLLSTFDESGSVLEQEVEPPTIANGIVTTSRITFGNGFNGTNGEVFSFNVQANTAGTGTITINQTNSEVLPEDGSPSVLGTVQPGQITINTPEVSAPTITPNGGSFTGQTSVTLLAEAGAEIYYTLDTTVPTIMSPKYSTALTLKRTSTVKALAKRSDGTLSPIASATFTRTDEPHGTGTVMREYFANIAGTKVSDLTSHVSFAKAPTSLSEPSLFEGPTGAGSDYGARYAGYVTAPEDGLYTFWVAADASAELWLSTDTSVEKKQKIAQVTTPSGIREWEKSSSQKSVSIALTGGQKYYIEALHKASSGSDHMSVGWQLPNGAYERPIAGTRLTPYHRATLTLEKSASVTKAAPGDTIVYTITYTNNGNHPATSITLNDVLSNDLAFVSASDNGQFTNNQVVWTIPGSVAVGASGSVTLTTKVK